MCSSPGKLLDVDDHYYRTLSSSRSEPCLFPEDASPYGAPERRPSLGGSVDGGMYNEPLPPATASRPTLERAVTEPQPPRTACNDRYVTRSSGLM